MKNGQEKTKMFNVPPLYNPSQNRTNKPSPPLLNISEIKRSSNEKIKGIYNPFVTRKRNLDGNCVYEEYTCVVKYKCVRQVTMIEDNKEIKKAVYFYLIEYEENHNSLRKLVNLEEIYFEDDLDFLYLKTIELKPIIINNKKRKIKKLNESISPNENMFQNTIKPALTIDIEI